MEWLFSFMKIIDANDADIQEINIKLDQFNNAKVAFLRQDEIFKKYVIKDNDKIIAGIESVIYQYNILYIHALFVDENFRHKGFGSVLLQKVESNAIDVGAKLSHLDTFDFQAKDFYLKHGYEIFGILDNCPQCHKRYYMKKIIAK
jgi:GNAT superfamily N-acetyltransferase